jgi:hypothetical protein
MAQPENRINVDRVFDTCILLLTVLAAAEFAYLAYLLPVTESANLTLVNTFFRVTTTVIIALVVGWILLSLIPSPPETWKLGVLWRFRRRYVKEFCWCLFGNLFVYEIFTFVFYSFFNGESAVVFMVYYSLFFALLLTLPASWQYYKIDQKASATTFGHHRLRWLLPIVEHVVIFVVSYLVLQQVMLFSVSVPVPTA